MGSARKREKMTIKKASEELAAAKAIAEKASTENRSMSEAERTDFERHLTAGKDMKSATELLLAAEKISEGTAVTKSYASAGEKFVTESKDWLTANSDMDGKGLINSPSVEIGSIKSLIVSGFGTSDGSAGAALVPEAYGLVSPTSYQYNLTALDLISVSATQNTAVQYAQISPLDGDSVDAAGQYAQGVATNDSTLAFIKKLAPVHSTRAYLPASLQSLSDWGQLQGYINNFLGWTVKRQLENQVINGSGSGENHTGILATSGVNEVSFNSDIITTIRNAITAVQVNGNTEPTAILLHPYDYEKVDLLTGALGQYYFAQGMTPAGQTVPTFGGIARIKSRSVTPGTAIVGDFKQAIYWERQGMQVSVSNSHADLFIKEAVAVLASARGAFGILNPRAFAVASLTA